MKALRWLTIGGIVLAAILVPFVVFGEALEASAAEIFRNYNDPRLIWPAVIALLAGDVFLPVPSSLVSTSAGALLGFPMGLAASTLGMSAGCLLGYGFGWYFGTPLLRRFAGEREMEAVERQFAMRGAWAVALLRPVPVLAEASVLFAGAARTRRAPFAVASVLMNAAVSAVYSATGALALRTGWYVAGFAALLAISALAFGAGRWFRRTDI